MTKSSVITQQVLERLKQGTGARSDSELARILGISQQSVSNARNNGKVPDSWIRSTAEQFNLNADWLFFGRGGAHAGPMPPAGEGQTGPHRLSSPGAPGWGLPVVADPRDLRINELEQQLTAAKEETLAAYRLITQHFQAISRSVGELASGSSVSPGTGATESAARAPGAPGGSGGSDDQGGL